VYQFNSILFNKQQKLNDSTAFTTISLGSKNHPKSDKISTLTSGTNQINENLFFLQKTLRPADTVSTSSFNLSSKTPSQVTLNTLNTGLNLNFLYKIHFLSLSSSTKSTTNILSDVFNEDNYALSTKLNPAFTSIVSISTNLGELNLNSTKFDHDPM